MQDPNTAGLPPGSAGGGTAPDAARRRRRRARAGRGIGDDPVMLAARAGPEAGGGEAASCRANVGEFNARGFTIVPGVFQPAEMESLAATVSELAAEEVANIVASGVLRDPDVLDWSSPEDYSSWQRSNPEWQRTIVAMSKVQVMPDTGEIVARKLNTPIAEFPACKAFRAVALSPKMLELASSLLGGRKAFVYSDQVFIKPPEIGGAKPWHQDNWYVQLGTASRQVVVQTTNYNCTAVLGRYFGVTSSDDVLTAWVSLDDATVENGALRYIDGGHHQGLVRHEVTNITEPYNVNAVGPLELAREVVAPVGQGGVVFHHGAALHSSTTNSTPLHRRAYAIHYVAAGAMFYDDCPTAVNGPPLGRLLCGDEALEEEEAATWQLKLQATTKGNSHHQATAPTSSPSGKL